MVLEEKTRIAQRLAQITPTELQTLFEGLQRQHEQILQTYRREAAVVERLYDALAGGDMADVYDTEAATAIAENEGYPLLPHVAVQVRVSSFLTPETLPESELRQAELALRGLMEHEPFESIACHGMGNLLSVRLHRYEEAERYYRRAIDLDPQNAWPRSGLGDLLSDHLQRYEEAEQAYRRAIELEPQEAWPWIRLGHLLSDHCSVTRRRSRRIGGRSNWTRKMRGRGNPWLTAIGSFPTLRGGGASVPAGHRTGPAGCVAVGPAWQTTIGAIPAL